MIHDMLRMNAEHLPDKDAIDHGDSEVEEVLQRCNGVRFAAVIGIPDEVAGQCIKAYVVKGAEELDPKYVLKFCCSELPPFMVPRAVEFVNQLPMTPNGKVDYHELRRCDAGTRPRDA